MQIHLLGEVLGLWFEDGGVIQIFAAEGLYLRASGTLCTTIVPIWFALGSRW